MMKDEYAEKSEILADLKRDYKECLDAEAQTLLLKIQFENKKRLTHARLLKLREKVEGASLSEEEKAALFSDYHLSRETASELHLPLQIHKELLTKDPTCFFDCPELLQITILYNDESSKVIDVLGSLRKTPTNIGHPRITQAITRYVFTMAMGRNARHLQPADTTVQLTYQQAEDALSRIFDTVKQWAQTKAKERQRNLDLIKFGKEFYRFPSDYFMRLFEEYNEAKRQKKDVIPTIKQWLSNSYPEIDHTEVLEFIKESIPEGSMPKRSGGGDPLRNAFVLWSRNRASNNDWDADHVEVKKYLSKGSRSLDEIFNGSPVSAEDLFTKLLAPEKDQETIEQRDGSHSISSKGLSQHSRELGDEFRLVHYGFAEAPSYEDLSLLQLEE